MSCPYKKIATSLFILVFSFITGCSTPKFRPYIKLTHGDIKFACSIKENQYDVSLAMVYATPNYEYFPIQQLTNLVYQNLNNIGMIKSPPITPLYNIVDNQTFNNKLFTSDYALLFFVNKKEKGKYQFDFYIHDVKANSAIVANQIQLDASRPSLMRTAYALSDLVYNCMVGQRGIFSNHLLYAKRKSDLNELSTSDYDGKASKNILKTSNALYFPRYFRKKQFVLYLSGESPNAPAVFAHDILTGQRLNLRVLPDIPTRMEIDSSETKLLYDNPDKKSIYIYDISKKEEFEIGLSELVPEQAFWSEQPDTFYVLSKNSKSPGIYKYNIKTKTLVRISNLVNINSFVKLPKTNTITLLLENTDGSNEVITLNYKTMKHTFIEKGKIKNLGLSSNRQFLFYTKMKNDIPYSYVKSIVNFKGYVVPDMSILHM